MGEYALTKFRELQGVHRLIGDVRGRGCLLGLELVIDRTSKEPAVDAADAVLYAALSRGLSFKISMGNVITLAPPMIVKREHIDLAISILDESLSEAEATL
jgi:4-aminobutyrate aminotransferase